MELILNDDQENGLNTLLEFENSTETEFCLQGYAGTGKTTLLKKYIEKSKYKNLIRATAPTHKAKEIINELTGITAVTIQNLCGLRPYIDLENFNINRIDFNLQASPLIQNFKIILIDECSMISKDLYTFLKNQAEQFKVKLIYIGDPLQLPPVKEIISLTFLIKNKFILTKIERQNFDNPLTNLLELLRNEILLKSNDIVTNEIKLKIGEIPEKSFFTFLYENQENLIPKLNGIITINEGYKIITDKYEFIELVLHYFKSDVFKKNINAYRVTGWTNDCISNLNKYIRNNLNEVEVNINKKDLLFSYLNIIDDNDFILKNSKEYKIGNVKEFKDSYGINILKCEIKTTTNKKIQISEINIVKNDSYEIFLYIFNKKLQNCLEVNRKATWTDFSRFKELHLLTETLSNPIQTYNKDKSEVIGFYQGKPTFINKNIDYIYSTTIHKLQGSTFDTIFIHLSDILKSWDNILQLKLLYVAISRAKNSVYFLKS